LVCEGVCFDLVLNPVLAVQPRKKLKQKSFDFGFGSLMEFAVGASIVLLAVRSRFKNPRTLLHQEIFRSAHFSDKEILLQLSDERFQTALASHGWEDLFQQGPCFMSLTKAMLRGQSLAEAIRSDQRLNSAVRAILLERRRALEDAMREIAESYLKRKLSKQPSRGKTVSKAVPEVVLKGEKTGKLYKPVKFIARGSAGAVYTAVRFNPSRDRRLEGFVSSVTQEPCQASKPLQKLRNVFQKQLQRQLALKQVEPTQKSSAENENRIASILAQDDMDCTCVTYLDRMDESPERMWLLLRRINPSPYGIDLAEYIECQFFEHDDPVYHELGQTIVLQLLRGLDYIANCGICMRDVKPDNVLIDYDQDVEGKIAMNARWSDFGLSVDLGKMLDGSGIRSVTRLANENLNPSDDEVREALIGFWYDTQKIVPKPKWKGRRPPEQCYQNPMKVHLSSYDLYMVGIIIVSMALGIDVPHIDKEKVRKAFEAKVDVKLADGFEDNFELGDFIRKNQDQFLPCFTFSFGKPFGEALLRETILMLAKDPRERPRPIEAHQRLSSLCSEQVRQHVSVSIHG